MFLKVLNYDFVNFNQIPNFKKFKHIILFLGKSGKEILKEATNKWKFDYEERKSLTNEDSLVIKISNLKKR